MARRRTNISTIKRSDGSKAHRVRIRRKGVPEFSAYLDSQEKAFEIRDRQAGRVHDIRHTGADPEVTVREAINHYRKSDRYRALTRIATVEGHLKYWDARFAETRLVDISVVRLMDEAARLQGAGYSGSTIHHKFSALSCAWAEAALALGATPNRVRDVRLPKIKHPPPRKFTDAQLKLLEERMGGYKPWPALGLFVRMSQLTTQRKITILSLLWEGVNLVAGRVETPPTKNGSTATLVVAGETLDLLREHHAREQAAGRGGRKDYVFQSPKLHQPIDPKKHVDWLFDHPDFDGKTFKHLRSTTLSRLFTHAKMDVTRVMAISKHRTARVLLEHYAHADTDECARVIEEHADVLLGK